MSQAVSPPPVQSDLRAPNLTKIFNFFKLLEWEFISSLFVGKLTTHPRRADTVSAVASEHAAALWNFIHCYVCSNNVSADDFDPQKSSEILT